MRLEKFLPDIIRVGYRSYKVVVWDPEVAEARKMYGECDHIAHTIRLDINHPPEQVAETLWHECLHAAFDVGCANRLDELDEEAIVSFMSSWTMTMLTQNPQLADFLSRAATGRWTDD